MKIRLWALLVLSCVAAGCSTGKERLEAFHCQTGATEYRVDFPADYRGGVNPDQGPRCVPVVRQGVVVLFGAAGTAHAVKLENGRKLWSRNLFQEWSGNEGYFGAGSTPLVLGKKVLFNVGGRQQGGLIALDLRSGEPVWNATNEAASYASPVFVRVGGRTHAFFVTRLNALLVNAENGKIMAQRPFGKRGPTVNAATPIVVDDRVFLTASYGVGAVLVDLTRPRLAAVWENDRTLSSQYNTPVYADGFLYGIHGREDVGNADLRCIDFATGHVAWSKSSFGVAHVIRAGNRLLLLKVDGTLVLAAVNMDHFESLGEQDLPLGTARALPALSQRTLFVRDENKLIAVRL